MGQRIVKLINFVNRLRRKRCSPERLLLLLPNCIQNSECNRNVVKDINNCRRCGNCKVGELIDLARKYGCQIAIVTGGRLALQLAKRDDVDAVVAVACEKELLAGQKALFPKPSLGVINIRPHGPCVDTDVDIKEVEKAICSFIE